MAITLPENLVVLEIANNHMGDVSHGIELINQYSKICKNYPQFNYAFKLQYRQLDKFIHKAYKDRFDLHYIKRFQETKLEAGDFDKFVDCIKSNGHYAMVTAFDNESYELISRQPVDIVKVASCSFNDWPLLESAAELDLPIIASTAGASLENIDNVISFLSNRKKDYAIMHCVAQYPTPDKNMHLSQLGFLQKRYPGVRVGFSTHEDPASADMIKMAIAKGANIFEKHVALPTKEYSINAYSVDLTQFEDWLKAASFAIDVCGNGDERLLNNKEELASLKDLRRGIFLKNNLSKGHVVTSDDVYFAYPSEGNAFTANDYSKYSIFTLTKDCVADEALDTDNTCQTSTRKNLVQIVDELKAIISSADIKLPSHIPLEVSHHYGLDNFKEHGMGIITLINRSYAKKLLICVPGQKHPEQYHLRKEETFRLLYGDVALALDGQVTNMAVGDIITVEKEVRHEFSTERGCVIEEISDTHFADDSFYTDEKINKNLDRKTVVTLYTGK